ncbi:hypothetical protein [Priestia megaterium]
MKFHKIKPIFIASLVLLLFLTPAFGEKAEAASPPVPDTYLALFFSHIVYDGQQAVFKGQSPTGKLLNGTYSPKFNKSWINLNKHGYYTKYTPSTYGNAIGAGQYRMYDALSNPKTNFYGAIYKHVTENKYIVAFAGTNKNESGDIKSDAKIGLGIWGGPAQLKQARMLVSKIPKNASKVIYTGHSLGGYIAAEMTIETGRPSIVFSAPGFVSDDARIKAYFSRNKNLIIRHEFDKDNILSALAATKIIPYNYYGGIYVIPSDYRPGSKIIYGKGIKSSKVADNMHSLSNFYTTKLHQGY